MNHSKKLYAFTLIITLIAISVFFFWRPLRDLWQKEETGIQIHSVPFSRLPSWGKTDLKSSFTAFQRSCNIFLRAPADKSVGSNVIPLKASDWRPACLVATSDNAPHTQKELKSFFETWFSAYEFYDKTPVHGLFTGYYVPAIEGSLTKTSQFTVPIYGMPDDLVIVKLADFDPLMKNRQFVGRVVNQHNLVPYHTTADINNNALSEHAPILAWVKSPIDRLFLQIQGSGIINLPDGSSLHLDYAAQNGAPYTAIGGILIKKGVMTKEKASMQGIRAYLESHPEEIDAILNQNQSFVFFQKSKQTGALGSQNAVLTPGYSLAVDLNWVPIGTPIWLNTTRPDTADKKAHPFLRLMIAQDTGGAIRGPVRGDVFWGEGKKATAIAGKMKQPGVYWLLLPKNSL